jgi:hypothetical protein
MWGGFKIDVSGLTIGPIFKGQDVLRSNKIRPVGSPETAALNHLTPRNNPEDGWVYLANWLPITTITVAATAGRPIGLTIWNWWFYFHLGRDIYLLFKPFILTLVLPWFFLNEYRAMMLTIHLRLVQSLRMYGAVPSIYLCGGHTDYFIFVLWLM